MNYILSRQERKIQKIKAEILEKASEFFLTKGYENANMDEIADSVPISKTTIYKYFNSKEEILHSILSELLDIINTLVDKRIDKNKSGFEQMHSLAEEFLYLLNSDVKLQHFFLLERGINTRLYYQENFRDILDGIRKLLKLASDMIEKGIRDKSIKQGVNPVKTGIEMSILFLGFCSMISERKYYILCEEMGQPIEEVMQGVVDHLLLVIRNLKA
jgi:AcrR family transcriptional regulator